MSDATPGAETPWDASMPLRWDATRAEVIERMMHEWQYTEEPLSHASAGIAYEYAMACSAEARREMAAQLAAVEAERDEARQTLANVQDMLMGSTEDVLASEAERERLKREVEILRQYGNKDCTAMADAALKEFGHAS